MRQHRLWNMYVITEKTAWAPGQAAARPQCLKLKTIGDSATAQFSWFNCASASTEAPGQRKMCSPACDKLIHHSASAWQVSFQVKSSAKSERARESGKQWRKTRRQSWEQWGDNEGGERRSSLRTQVWQSLVSVWRFVIKVKVPLGRNPDNGLLQPPAASRRYPGQTCTLRQMLFVLSSSACQLLSLNDVGWNEDGK